MGLPVDSPDATRRPSVTGGSLRVFLSQEAIADASYARAVGRPVPIAREQVALDPGQFQECREYDLDATATPGDGPRLLAEDWIEHWRRLLLLPGHDARWLLQSVVTDERDALRAEGMRLAVCVDEPTPDLRERLQHPALWMPNPVRAGNNETGRGPFMATAEHRLTRNPAFEGQGGWLDRVERVTGEHPELLLQLDEVDLMLAYGRLAEACLQTSEREGPQRQGTRVPDLDLTYALWMDPARRWVNDPRLRHWLVGQLDRPAMIEALFAGRGQPIDGFTPLDTVGSEATATGERPLSETSVPRIELGFNEQDPLASTLASRIKAELGVHRIELRLVPFAPPELARALRAGLISAALILHRPQATDPVLAMMESVSRLGPSAEPSRVLLRQAARWPDSQQRRETAEAAADLLVSQAMLVPLVQLHAWLVHDPRLTGLDQTVPGALGFEWMAWTR